MGVTISLDDFGTGYASLSQLRSLPFDRIKIDKSFVTSLLSDSQSDAIVGTILSLGRALKLPITAEGIEDDGTRERLRSLGMLRRSGMAVRKGRFGRLRSSFARNRRLALRFPPSLAAARPSVRSAEIDAAGPPAPSASLTGAN